MRASLATIVLLLTLGMITLSVAAAHELSGHVAVEATGFPNDPLYPEQERNKIHQNGCVCS